MPSRPRRVRLEDVAAQAKVSTATASLVLREKPGPSDTTRIAVTDAARTLGYRANRTASLLASRRNRLLGVMMDVSNPFHAELLGDLHAAADEGGYDVVVSPLTRMRDEQRAVETLIDSRVEALLLMGPTLSDTALSALAVEQPVVVIGRRVSAAGVDVVRAADDIGVALAVQHLVELGHCAIAFVDGPRGAIAMLRRKGYRAAMKRLVGPDASWVVSGGDTEDAGSAAISALLPSDRRPTALVVFNDRAALGVLDRLRRDGVDVPRQMSVVGYDDSPIARLATVDLTTVSQAPEAMAVAAVKAAIEHLEDGIVAPVDVVLDPHLVVRATTSAPFG